MQLFAQTVGLYHIRPSYFSLITSLLGIKDPKQDVQGHKFNMHAVFFGGCLIPAVMRFPALIGLQNPSAWNSYAWAIPLLIGSLSLYALKRGSWI